MEIYEGIDDLRAGFGPSAVAVGKFDGIHLGHRDVLTRLRAAADAAELEATVVTFDRNPLTLLRPDHSPDALVSDRQKAELLQKIGIDATVTLEFTTELRELAPEDFVRRILVGALGAKLVFAGADFKFGVNGSGTIETLRDLGERYDFEVVALDDDTLELAGWDGPRRISSTWVREALAKGDVRTAARLLGRSHRVESTVVHGEQRGRELGYPTANLDPAVEGLLPADGVYAAWATVDGQRYGAAVSVGNNPTFDGVPQHQAEAHLLDQKLDLYGKHIALDFVEHIRPMRKFDSAESLVESMNADEAKIRVVLAAEA